MGMFRCTNALMASLGTLPCTRSEDIARRLQYWSHRWIHSWSCARKPLRITRCRIRTSFQSILRSVLERQAGTGACPVVALLLGARCGALGALAFGPCVLLVAPLGAPAVTTLLGLGAGAGLGVVAAGRVTCGAGAGAGVTTGSGTTAVAAGVFVASGGATAEAFGFVPKALKARAVTASQRRRTVGGDTWPSLLGLPSTSSKESRRSRSLRSVFGLREFGGHSLRDGRPRLPSSPPRWVRKSRKALASGQAFMGHSHISISRDGLDLVVPCGTCDAAFRRKAVTRRTCKSSLN
mmetsp:Transcript_14189/g.25053  ORF Transcript_14189/g.25053 Transcript_14189/m.25053 type:complete len:294 (-) Transcript_14189:703-1584(-)